MSEIYSGGCHCGNIKVTFHATKPFEELPIRACQCSFCRKHNVRATADPDGRLEIKITDETALNRYHLGLGITDFLVCRKCGVYVCATIEDEEIGGTLATLVVNTLDLDQSRICEPVAAIYDDESEDGRRARRRQRWMRAEFI